MDTNDGRGEMRRVGWDFVPEAVVVGNGEFPVSALPLRILDTAPFTVCCDGAADRCLESGRVPDRIVGDQSCELSIGKRISSDCHCRCYGA